MSNILKNWAGTIALVIAIVALFTPSSKIVTQLVNDGNLRGITNYDSLTLGENLIVGGTATFTGATSISGQITANAGLLRSYTNSTSTTATAQTLAVGDLLNYDTVLLTPNTGALTLTFPASSTMSTLVPTAGDMQETCFYNATSTAAATITFVAGTGINIVSASSTTGIGIPLIQAGGTGCFKFIRQPATTAAFDITAAWTRYVTAD